MVERLEKRQLGNVRGRSTIATQNHMYGTARVETSFRLSENNLYLKPNAKALVCKGSLIYSSVMSYKTPLSIVLVSVL